MTTQKQKQLKTSKGRKAYQQETFSERHQRMTIYLTKENYHELQYQREQGKILNLTSFFNELLEKELFRK